MVHVRSNRFSNYLKSQKLCQEPRGHSPVQHILQSLAGLALLPPYTTLWIPFNAVNNLM